MNRTFEVFRAHHLSVNKSGLIVALFTRKDFLVSPQVAGYDNCPLSFSNHRPSLLQFFFFSRGDSRLEVRVWRLRSHRLLSWFYVRQPYTGLAFSVSFRPIFSVYGLRPPFFTP